mmetsp:Transcript_36037/g.103552  ORF Transcript_36037/g.103552 Transcript_36037/m.103552 type:complete len:254 (-) Transcript_36037:1725-2486(-)
MAQSQITGTSASTRRSAKLEEGVSLPRPGTNLQSLDKMRKPTFASTSTRTSLRSRSSICHDGPESCTHIEPSADESIHEVEELISSRSITLGRRMLCAISKPSAHFSSRDSQEDKFPNNDTTAGLSEGSNFKHASLMALLSSKYGDPGGIGSGPTHFVRRMADTALSKSSSRLSPKGLCPVVTRWTSQPKEKTSELVAGGEAFVYVSGALHARVPPCFFERSVAKCDSPKSMSLARGLEVINSTITLPLLRSP